MLTKWYKNLSVKVLGLAVTPSIIGDVPQLPDNALTFYVLEDYSRTNSLLLQEEIHKLGMPSALSPIKTPAISENSAMIFLKHRRAKTERSPRLQRLIQAILDNPTLRINLVPVTILWGRSPDKEESLLKLLFADEWRVPSIGKQLFNIGVMGRDTFVQFYPAQHLNALIAEEQTQMSPTDNPPTSFNIAELTKQVQWRLEGYLSKQRASILGPDISDKRGISRSIMTAPDVHNAMTRAAQSSGKPLPTIKKEVQSYINEIASDYTYSVVYVFERFLTWLWTRLYDGVEVHHFERVRALAPDHQIIYVPCHRSHMDYLLLSYVIHNQGLRMPHVAAGNNLNLPILGEILRSGGAFFLRRSFRDNPLYGTILKEYFHHLMQRGSPIEYFIEGGRSRSGRLLAPKLGMLAMTVNSYLRAPARPVVFIPAYISYERIIEGATYVGELKGKPKESENLLGLIKAAKKIERIYGRVNLSFGTPLFLSDLTSKFAINPKTLAQDSAPVNEMIANLGIKIMQHINKAAVVNPISLVALVLLSAPKAVLDKHQFLQQLALCQKLATALPYDPDTVITTMNPTQMMTYTMSLKLITCTPHLLGDVIAVADKQAPMLSYFKNNILHIFILPSLLAALVQKNGRISKDDLCRVIALLYPFLQAELFLKYSQKHLDTIIISTLQVLIDAGIVVDLGNGTIASTGGNSSEYQHLLALAHPAQQSLERYFMTLSLLANQGSGKITQRQIVELAHLVGSRISALYGDDLPDRFDKALFESFISALIRANYAHFDKNNCIDFDERILRIGSYAHLVLSSDVMYLINQANQLSASDLETLGQSKHKKRLFGR